MALLFKHMVTKLLYELLASAMTKNHIIKKETYNF